jgi:glycosyltransferase involved in cell wall biosynthesis
VSQSSLDDIAADHEVDRDRLHVVPVGVDQDLFRPLDDVERIPGRLITTASADVTMKGLRYLLEALAKLRTERDVSLVVIGREKPGGPSSRLLDELGLRDIVQFVTGVPEERIIELYSESEVAVVPSLYEGFSLPAIEAMSCGVPLVATTGGALPEVVGADDDTALLVPPGDAQALAAKISLALDDPERRARIGAAGRQRVIDRWTWRHTAVGTVEHYRALLAETGHIQARRPGGLHAAPRFRRAPSPSTAPGSGAR